MSRIQCPYCGSTAQPRFVWVNRDYYGTREIKEYTCGCGCKFEAIFELKETKILEIKAPHSAKRA